MSTFRKARKKLPIIKPHTFTGIATFYLYSVTVAIPFYINTMQSNLRKQKLVMFGVALLLVFSYPLISIANQPVFTGRFPLLFVYVFVVWICAIIMLYRLAERNQKRTDE